LKKLKDTPFYNRAIHEINYSFGDFYLFDTFVVGEFHENVHVTWKEHGRLLAKEICNLYDSNGKDLIYISNRVNDYSLVPTDWKNFFDLSYKLKAYGIVSYTKTGFFNAMLERMFVNTKLRWFDSLENAIEWVGKNSNSNVMVPIQRRASL